MNGTSTLKIAVLLACHNRKLKTLAFLDSLVKQQSFNEFFIDIYLLDDGSTDGTAEEVKKQFPFVNILAGSGKLFWAGGMRTIWQYAVAQKPYNLFCLFNDDVILFNNALENLIRSYTSRERDGIILIGSTLDPHTNKISYGGNRLVMHRIKAAEYSLIEPDEHKLVPCLVGNANILLVDNATVKKIGFFSKEYTHYLADFDYTYTAHKAGISVMIAPGYYGYCEFDHGANWLPSAKASIRGRIKYLYSPKGLTYREYLFFVKKNFPGSYFSAFTKLWMKTLFPVIWDKFKKNEAVKR